MSTLKDRINVTFSEFQHLVDSWRDGIPHDDAMRMLSYMGWTYFQILRESMPSLTLEQCFAIHLGTDEQSSRALDEVKLQNSGSLM